MNLRKMAYIALSTLGAIALVSCGSGGDRAGATTETTNGFGVTVLDSTGKVLENIRLVAYTHGGTLAVDSAITNSNGKAWLELSQALDSLQLEAIGGSDSTWMGWFKIAGDSMNIKLKPSARLTIRTAATSLDSLPEEMQLTETPYRGKRFNRDFIFGRVPAGRFAVIGNAHGNPDSSVDVGSVLLTENSNIDTLLSVDSWTRVVAFENFNDGDSKHIFAEQTGSQGWYINASGGSSWISPSVTTEISSALLSSENADGRYLSLHFTATPEGTLLLGTHLGSDASVYNLSGLTAIRFRVRGDAAFAFALEQGAEVISGVYEKSLWNVQATDGWREVVLRPGEEEIKEANHQITFADGSSTLAIMTFFVWSGTWLEIDDIMLEGLETSAFDP